MFILTPRKTHLKSIININACVAINNMIEYNNFDFILLAYANSILLKHAMTEKKEEFIKEKLNWKTINGNLSKNVYFPLIV